MSEAEFMSFSDTYWPDKWFAEKEAQLRYPKGTHRSNAVNVEGWMNKPPTSKQLARIALIRSSTGVVFTGNNRGQAQEFILTAVKPLS